MDSHICRGEWARYADDDVSDWEFVAKLGERVREVRALTRLTAEQVERIAGLRRGVVTAIESGTMEAGPYDLLAVADVMGVTLDFLIDVGGGDAFERYRRVSAFTVAQRERMTARTAPVYRSDNLPIELIESARPAFRPA